MNVVICSTRNWYWYLAVNIYALLKNNKVNKIYLFIEDDNISYIQNKRIEFININNIQQYIKTNSPNYNTKYTRFSFIRCYLSKILKENKILYIDADAIVIDNIQELWNINLDNYAIAGVKETGEWSKHLNKQNMDDKYINSGVLLMNLDYIRKNKLDDKMLELLNTKLYMFPDQDIINIVCEDKIKYISNIYNSTETTGMVENAKIIHYIRQRKGWIKESPRSDIWFSYQNKMFEEGGIKMVKCEVIMPFHLGDFYKLQNMQRKGISKEGFLYIGDIFECDEEMAKYLTTTNSYNKAYVKVIGVIPEIKKEEIEPIKEKTKKTTTRKRKTIAKE